MYSFSLFLRCEVHLLFTEVHSGLFSLVAFFMYVKNMFGFDRFLRETILKNADEINVK